MPCSWEPASSLCVPPAPCWRDLRAQVEHFAVDAASPGEFWEVPVHDEHGVERDVCDNPVPLPNGLRYQAPTDGQSTARPITPAEIAGSTPPAPPQQQQQQVSRTRKRTCCLFDVRISVALPACDYLKLFGFALFGILVSMRAWRRYQDVVESGAGWIRN